MSFSFAEFAKAKILPTMLKFCSAPNSLTQKPPPRISARACFSIGERGTLGPQGTSVLARPAGPAEMGTGRLLRKGSCSFVAFFITLQDLPETSHKHSHLHNDSSSWVIYQHSAETCCTLILNVDAACFYFPRFPA